MFANRPNLESHQGVEASAEEAEVVSEEEVLVTEETEAAAASLVEEEEAAGPLATAMEGAEEEAVVETGSGKTEDHPEIEMTAETLGEQEGEVTTMVVITGTTDFEFNTPEYLNIGMHL